MKLNKKGATLIELIVAFALVIVSSAYFYQTLTTVYDLYAKSKKETEEFIDKDYDIRIAYAYMKNNGTRPRNASPNINLSNYGGSNITLNVDFPTPDPNYEIANIGTTKIVISKAEIISDIIMDNNKIRFENYPPGFIIIPLENHGLNYYFENYGISDKTELISLGRTTDPSNLINYDPLFTYDTTSNNVNFTSNYNQLNNETNVVDNYKLKDEINIDKLVVNTISSPYNLGKYVSSASFDNEFKNTNWYKNNCNGIPCYIDARLYKSSQDYELIQVNDGSKFVLTLKYPKLLVYYDGSPYKRFEDIIFSKTDSDGITYELLNYPVNTNLNLKFEITGDNCTFKILDSNDILKYETNVTSKVTINSNDIKKFNFINTGDDICTVKQVLYE